MNGGHIAAAIGVCGSLVAATTMGHKGTNTQCIMTYELRNCLIN